MKSKLVDAKTRRMPRFGEEWRRLRLFGANGIKSRLVDA
jgi:hypothetical protein